MIIKEEEIKVIEWRSEYKYVYVLYVYIMEFV